MLTKFVIDIRKLLKGWYASSSSTPPAYSSDGSKCVMYVALGPKGSEAVRITFESVTRDEMRTAFRQSLVNASIPANKWPDWAR